MKRVLTTLSALLLTGALGPAAAGAGQSFETTVVYLGSEDLPTGEDVLFGNLDSVKKCRGDRRIKLLISSGDAFELADTARSSANGAWAVQGDFTMALGGAKVKVLREKLGNGDVCQPDSAPIPT